MKFWDAFLLSALTAGRRRNMIRELGLRERMLPAPRHGGFSMEGYWVWCGSVMKGEDGRYHMFASRWPKTQPMHPGWLLQSEVVRASADTPCGPYDFEEVVLPVRGPQYWDGRMTHNPVITKSGGQYVLYYIGATHPFEDIPEDYPLVHEDYHVKAARSRKRIGVATADSICGPWKRQDHPVLHPRPGCFDNMFVSNPAPCIREDGSALLIYKSRSYIKPPYEGQMYGAMALGAAEASEAAGPYRAVSEEPLFPPETVVEDPFIWHDGTGYQMIAKDMYGNLCGERFGGAHGFSRDGIHWQINQGELVYSREVLWDDGVRRWMGNLDRPFLLFEDGRPTHMFFGTSDGTDGFMDAGSTWNMVIPLRQE